jgi:tryptophanyl-tRNA synthetase
MEALYRRGGFGYGEVKKALADAADRFFAAARQRRAEIEKDPAWVDRVLQDGAAKARATAAKVLDRVKKACGILAV